jgi:UDP-3-O-[3-hydroxymyristoyl] glucosamine N-acyltransferase
VKVSVDVFVNVAVAVGEDVSVGVNINLGVLVGRKVLVGLGVLVGLEVFVGFGVLLGLGAASTTAGARPRKDTSIKKIIVNRPNLNKNVFIADSSLHMVIDKDCLHPTLLRYWKPAWRDSDPTHKAV